MINTELLATHRAGVMFIEPLKDAIPAKLMLAIAVHLDWFIPRRLKADDTLVLLHRFQTSGYEFISGGKGLKSHLCSA
jgi:hypothetical protein